VPRKTPPENIAESREEWISVTPYAKKYGYSVPGIQKFINNGVLTSKQVRPKSNPTRPRPVVLDLPPEQHPNWEKRKESKIYPGSYREKKLPQPPDGWLSVVDYAVKYAITRESVRRDLKSGWLTGKMCEYEKVPNTQAFYLPDIPPKRHPNYHCKPDKKTALKKKGAKHGLPPADGTLEKRRRKLAKYLMVFKEKAPFDKMYFTGPELMRLFGFKSGFMLYKQWAEWGLGIHPMPQGKTGENVYSRHALFRFFSGRFAPITIEEKKESTDAKVLDRVMGPSEQKNDGYYHYNSSNAYPINGDGCIQWIKDKKIRLLNKRSNQWEPAKLYDFQEEFIRKAFSNKADGDLRYNVAVACWERGTGKSVRRNTPVIMHDGSVKKSQDVEVGDMMMGVDSTPREVLTLGRGREEMFEVTPFKGDAFVCNKSHILALERRHSSRRRERITMHLTDYIECSEQDKTKLYLYRVPIDWPRQDVTVSPYHLGLWLGDGYTINGEHSALRDALGGYDLFDNKHIPIEYKANSREVRLQLLAGLMDSEGYSNGAGYEIAKKNKVLAEDIAFLARSLGFHVSLKKCVKGIKPAGFDGEYYRLCISGNCAIIPVRTASKRVREQKNNKNVLRSRIKSIKSVGIDDYYGFTLDGDHLYLLGDFTVTHNSLCVKLMGLFLFFNRRGESIVFAGSSRDQADTVHFKELKEICQRTPALAEIPGLEVQEKRIILRAGSKSIECELAPIASKTGLLTGTTSAIFTELHEHTDCKFFEDLWTSLRGIPNAIALVDTTVADKDHVVRKLYEAHREGDEMIYFDHHQTNSLVSRNPEITPTILKSYQRILMPHVFRKYFYNRWEDAGDDTLGTIDIRRVGVVGVRVGAHDYYGQSKQLDDTLKELVTLESDRDILSGHNLDMARHNRQIKEIKSKLIMVDDIYSMPASMEDVDRIKHLFKTEMFIFVGIDRAKMATKSADRTVLSCLGVAPVNEAFSYCFILDLFIPREDDYMVLQSKLIEWQERFGWIHKVTAEAYETKDLIKWCDNHGFEADMENNHPTGKKQIEIFVPFYMLVTNGYFKAPTIPYYCDDAGRLHEGYTNHDDIFRLELKACTFNADPKRPFFGSKEKNKRAGAVKDDTVFSVVWGLSGAIGADLAGMYDAARASSNGMTVEININSDVAGNYGNYDDVL